jgi:protein-disulfide isomerase/uncharacterized membrane protein
MYTNKTIDLRFDKTKHEKKKIKALPYPVYFWTVAVIAIGGLLDSIYLSISHYRVYMDIGYRSFCAISKSINCDTVSQSPYSIFLGVPVPIWGVFGYAFVLSMLPFAWRKPHEEKRLWALFFLIFLVFSLCSIVLAAISTFVIHSYCVMCMLSYGVNFLLLFYAYLILQRFETRGILAALRSDFGYLQQRKKKALAVIAPFCSALLAMLLFFPVYWSFSPPELSAYIPHGLTEDGHPWIGAENPKVEIVEFTDYQCFQCNKMHFFLRQAMVNHPGKIKLIHRHFPMDHEINPLLKEPLHPGSGKMAMMAIYAATQNKFWQMNDFLFSVARVTPYIRIREAAEQTGLDYKTLLRAISHRKIQYLLKKDIAYGLKLGITGTPSFLIDGKVYSGQIPPDILQKYLD